jgi:hypothetical protein
MTPAFAVCAKLLAFERKVDLVDLIEHPRPRKIGPVVFIDSSDRWIRASAVPALNLNLYLTRMDNEVDLTIGIPVSEHAFFMSRNFRHKYDRSVELAELENDLEDGFAYAKQIADFWKDLQRRPRFEIDDILFHRVDIPHQRGLRILYRNDEEVEFRFDLLDEEIGVDGPPGSTHVKFSVFEPLSEAIRKLKPTLYLYQPMHGRTNS